MKIFRIRVDVEKFQTIVPEDEGVWNSGSLEFDGKEKGGGEWQSPSLFSFDPLKRRGNFFYLSPGVLVFDEKAMDVLDDILEMAGEILETELLGERLFALNVTQCYNSLDLETTAWRIDPRSGKRLSIKQYVFHGNRFGESSIFKIPETVRAEVLTYSEVKGREDEFIARYQESSLEGLEFDLLFEC